MFYDDEMPAETTPRKPLYKWLRRIAIALLILAGLFCISLRILMTVGGHDESLKKGLEQYFQAATGMIAHINQLNDVQFYPAVKLDITDMALSPPSPYSTSAVSFFTPTVTVGSVKLSMGFWDILWTRHRVRALDIRNLDFQQPLHMPRPVLFNSIMLQKADTASAGALVVNGHYGPDEFNFRQSLDYTDPVTSPAYFRQQPRSHMTLSSSLLNLDGVLTISRNGLQFDMDKIGLPEKMLQGSALLHRDGTTYNFTGHFKGGHSQFELTITAPQGKPITGTIATPVFDPADAPIVNALRHTLSLFLPADSVITGPTFPAKKP